ncbi:MAG: septum formation initiator family protein [Desulfobacteraceae bacterium]|nr:septum formation initiator family protein [Desulfobacteraceae bacterium]
MNPGKSKFWKIPLIILCLLIGIVAWLGFGEQGLIHLYRTEMERQAHMDKIRRLAGENQDLLEEIDRLRTDMKYVESVARRQLNLIKENEVIYRFEKKEGGSSGLSSATVTGIEQADERMRPEREVFRNGKIK